MHDSTSNTVRAYTSVALRARHSRCIQVARTHALAHSMSPRTARSPLRLELHPPSPPALVPSFPRAVGSSCAVSCASGLALAGLPLWADVSGLRGLSSPLLELGRRRATPSTDPPCRHPAPALPAHPRSAATVELLSRTSTAARTGSSSSLNPVQHPRASHRRSGRATCPQHVATAPTAPHATPPRRTSSRMMGGLVAWSWIRVKARVANSVTARRNSSSSTCPSPRHPPAPCCCRGRSCRPPPRAASRRTTLCSTVRARPEHARACGSAQPYSTITSRSAINLTAHRRNGSRCDVCCMAPPARAARSTMFIYAARAAARTAAAAALRAIAIDLDLCALAGVADGSDDRRAAAIRATAGLLEAVRVRSLLVI